MQSKFTFRAPRKISGVQTKGAELGVSTANAYSVDAGGTELGHGWRTTRLVQSLLLEIGLSATGGTALVSTITRDTCLQNKPLEKEYDAKQLL